MEMNYEMQVVGVTTQQIVYVASRNRKFRMNEILIIEDKDLNYPKGEVIETQSFNKYIPLSKEKGGILDKSVLEGLQQIGFSIDDEEINLAKVRLTIECPFPIKTGVPARLPNFDEVKEFLVKTTPQNGLVLGILKGTEEIAKTMPKTLDNIAYLFDAETKKVIKQDAVPFIFDFKKMNQYPHIGIFGGSGSGKSFGLRVLIEELAKKRIPTIVFDPHFEMNFSKEMDGLPEDFKEKFDNKIICLSAGEDIGIDFYDLTTDELLNVLSSLGKLSDPMIDTVKVLHKKNDTLLSFQTKLEDLIFGLENTNDVRNKVENPHFVFKDEEERKKYHRSYNLLRQYPNIRSVLTLTAIGRKLNRLKQEGVFVSNVDKIKKLLLARKIVVIQGKLWLLQVMAGFIMDRMYRLRRIYIDSKQKPNQKVEEKFPPFFIIADEAHNFAHTTNTTPSKPKLREIAQEGRKYGVFLILATQRPSLLDETITAQLNTKFVFRTVRGSDINLIKEETDISPEEAKRLPYLQSGDCFISSAIIGRTLAVRIRVAKTTSIHQLNPFDELDDSFKSYDEDIVRTIKELCPISDIDMINKLKTLNEKTNAEFDIEEFTNILNDLVLERILVKKDDILGYTYDIIPN